MSDIGFQTPQATLAFYKQVAEDNLNKLKYNIILWEIVQATAMLAGMKQHK